MHSLQTSPQCWGNGGRCICSSIWHLFMLFGALLGLSVQSWGSCYPWANSGDLTACMHLIWTCLCKTARHSKHAEISKWEELWVCQYQTIILMLLWTSCSNLASLEGPGLLLIYPVFYTLLQCNNRRETALPNSSPQPALALSRGVGWWQILYFSFNY